MDDEYRLLKNSALGSLARREHSRKELRDKLLRKNANLALVDRVLDELLEDGYLSDQRFAESFYRYRMSQGKGPVRIRQELKLKGISDDTISEVVNEDESFWFEQALELQRRKFNDVTEFTPKEKARQIRFMLSRGFPYPIINALFEQSYS